MESKTDDLARRLGAIELKDGDGNVVKVSSAWAEQPALVVFVRHFG